VLPNGAQRQKTARVRQPVTAKGMMLKRGSSVNGNFADRQDCDTTNPSAVKPFTLFPVDERMLLAARDATLSP
ncbi:hypothetical protein, partial [Stenotrophomonas maltophilia]|uniref:hypothetical protein n=1 Tax=Stenotrophomonas maltophilia TaxID=40324 RepID=UPI00313DE0DC